MESTNYTRNKGTKENGYKTGRRPKIRKLPENYIGVNTGCLVSFVSYFDLGYGILSHKH